MNDIKIAGNKTIQQWVDIVGTKKNLKIDFYSNEKWDTIFEFFEERINTRYINPINAILNMHDNLGEGFAVVNLQCSLIETIESFINGCVHEYDVKSEKLKWKRNGRIIFHSNKSIFVSFFNKRTPFDILNISGEDFYEYVRCDLLHETQTKNNWTIKLDSENTGYSYLEKNGNYLIYRENFQRDLKKLIDYYKNSIINGEYFHEIEPALLRENFISKFNNICEKS
jgi:hypothetical protein